MSTFPRNVALAIVTVFLLAGPAHATVTQVIVNPPSAGISATQGSTLALTWQATSTPDATGPGGGGTLVTSATGVFRAGSPNGAVLGTNGQLLDGVAQGAPGQTGVAILPETLTVPASVLTQAANAGVTQIVYQRAFSDGPFQPATGNVANVTLTVATSLTVTVNPASATAIAGQASTVALTWQVTGNGGPGATVNSPQAVFRADGPNGRVLGTATVPLSAPLTTAGAATVAVLPETVQVPQIVAMRAEQAGASRIAYQRTFTLAGAPPATGTALLDLAGPQAGPFNISTIALRFDDGSREAVVAPDDMLHAYADVSHTGSGRLEAQWEVAEPASTRGTPVFRVLELVRQPLVGAATRTPIRSPQLPAGSEGVYLVRLRVTSPATPFDAPVLRYVVNPALIDAELQPIAATAPAPGAVQDAATRYAWEALDAATTYRVEFYEQSLDEAGEGASLPDAAPDSGIAVDGAVSETVLSALASSHLEPGRHYLWRVVAFDAAGRRIGVSEPRRVYVPADGDAQ